jgi:hypothetical protein
MSAVSGLRNAWSLPGSKVESRVGVGVIVEIVEVGVGVDG